MKKKKIYILVADFAYGSPTTIGYYSTREKAEAGRRRMPQSSLSEFRIEEKILDENEHWEAEKKNCQKYTSEKFDSLVFVWFTVYVEGRQSKRSQS